MPCPIDKETQPSAKTLRITELEEEAAALTQVAHSHYQKGERQEALELLRKRDSQIRPILVGLRAMLAHPPARGIVTA
jgi:hypothetical protein